MDAQPKTASFISPSTLSTPKSAPVSRPTAVNSDFVPALLQLLAIKDTQTRDHVNRVRTLMREWITYLQRQWILTDANVEMIEIAALLHDVGKVGVLDEILLKSEMLSEQERQHLEQHSELGYQMIRDYPGLAEIAEVIRYHHERWDGGGYPLGLRENQIPVASRLIAIVDTYDAITSDRPYQKARSEAVALAEIAKEAGRQFCPTFAAHFVQFMHARNT